ncbi:MAG: hypothetical protein JO061_08270 [Acidobacteriaceae bacterium]|nr:hypothetical protein [Acidobacteriaceae bacterium]
MQDAIIAALSGQEVARSNSLATVATTCVVIRTANARSRVIVSIGRISSVKRVVTGYPVCLPIAVGLFVMAAAAYCSKDGGSADLPIAGLGLVFLLVFFVTRRAALVFTVGTEQIRSVQGGLREASAIIRAVESAQARAADAFDREAVA